jgi:hypothetical protein
MQEEIYGFSVKDNGEVVFVVRSQGPFYSYTHGIMLSVTKLLPNGMLDTTFGLNGSFQDSIPNTSTLKSRIVTLVCGQGNTITIAGNNDLYGLRDPFVIRLIDKQKQHISADSMLNKVYGDSSFILTAVTSSGLPYSITVEDTNLAVCIGNTISILNAGVTFLKILAQGDSAFLPAILNIPLIINKHPIVATALDTSRMTGTQNPNFNVAYTGFVNGDTKADLDTLAVATCLADSSSPPGFYTISLKGGADNNYSFSYVDGILEVIDPAWIFHTNINKLFFYPNPSSSVVRIVLCNKDEEIRIIDMHGKIVFRQNLQGFEDKHFQLGVENFSAGTYVVQVLNKEKLRSAKLIIRE